jgi:hypothetical protein
MLFDVPDLTQTRLKQPYTRIKLSEHIGLIKTAGRSSCSPNFWAASGGQNGDHLL